MIRHTFLQIYWSPHNKTNDQRVHWVSAQRLLMQFARFLGPRCALKRMRRHRCDEQHSHWAGSLLFPEHPCNSIRKSTECLWHCRCWGEKSPQPLLIDVMAQEQRILFLAAIISKCPTSLNRVFSLLLLFAADSALLISKKSSANRGSKERCDYCDCHIPPITQLPLL